MIVQRAHEYLDNAASQPDNLLLLPLLKPEYEPLLFQDKTSEGPEHDQRVVGATTMLSTGYFQGRILRDWPMMRQFLLSVCQSDHNDKEEVRLSTPLVQKHYKF